MTTTDDSSPTDGAPADTAKVRHPQPPVAGGGEMKGWQPIETAPKNATWIVGRYKAKFHGWNYHVVHWADGGGDDQPRFRGWFKWSGASGGDMYQVDPPHEWVPFEPSALLSSPRVEEVRREALEEAAKVAEEWCERNGHPNGAWAIATAIRALANRPTAIDGV